MRADQQAETGTKWWVGAANHVGRRKLARPSTQAQREEQRTKTMRIAVVLSLFFALLAAALLAGGRSVIDPLLRAAADEREAKRVGDIVYTMPDGAFCRHVSFDNTTGELMQSAIEQCTHDISRVKARDGRGFAWGPR